ncbi:MAG: hypothetical protein J4G05_08365 [Chlorobi bacterium]|nr:hypothetical protein [Chlorobiota bacterium]
MPRALRYYVDDNGKNSISNEGWGEIARLQHWYNSEFIWSCDKIDLKRYILFPNYDHLPEMPYRTARYHFRKRLLAKKIEVGNWVEAVEALESEGLFHVRWGGTRDNSIASGITYVADNEYNAYLLCEFLLKCSTVSRTAAFTVEDEGRFILPGRVMFLNGIIQVFTDDVKETGHNVDLLDPPQIFSVVNHAKYDDHPTFSQNVDDFSELDEAEITAAVGIYGGLGFGENYDTQWGDHEGLNLQQRARKVVMLNADEHG